LPANSIREVVYVNFVATKSGIESKRISVWKKGLGLPNFLRGGGDMANAASVERVFVLIFIHFLQAAFAVFFVLNFPQNIVEFH
jgi:hypothetical protein